MILLCRIAVTTYNTVNVFCEHEVPPDMPFEYDDTPSHNTICCIAELYLDISKNRLRNKGEERKLSDTNRS